jgi:hypothetical protein
VARAAAATMLGTATEPTNFFAKVDPYRSGSSTASIRLETPSR